MLLEKSLDWQIVQILDTNWNFVMAKSRMAVSKRTNKLPVGPIGPVGAVGRNPPDVSTRIGRTKMAKLARLAHQANSANTMINKSAKSAKSVKSGRKDTLPARILVGSVSRAESVQQTCSNLKNAAKQMHEANTQLCMTPFCHHKPRLIMDLVHGMCLLATMGAAIWNVVLTVQGNATIKAMIPVFITSFFAVVFVIPSQICGALHARSVASYLSLTGSIITAIIAGILVGYLAFSPEYQNKSVLGTTRTTKPDNDETNTTITTTGVVTQPSPAQTAQHVFVPRIGLINR
jgi:hypothetical protein